MSTVDKQTADAVIAGKFADDMIIAIIEYENMFDGAKAYKLIYLSQRRMIDQYLAGLSPAMRNCKLYWKKTK